MMGPALNVKGGISTVVNAYFNSSLKDNYDIFYIATHVDGSRIKKSIKFLEAVLVFFLIVLLKPIKLVHIHSASRASFYRKAFFLIISKLFEKRVIFHIHGAEFDLFYKNSPKIRRLLISKILDMADEILVPSGRWAAGFISEITTNKNVKELYNPLTLINHDQRRTKKEDNNILFMGRLGKRKGTFDLLEIIPMVTKKYPDVKFVFCGDGKIEEVRHICKIKDIEKNCEIVGWVDGEEKIKRYEEASIFVLPSYAESFGLAVVEAMAYKLPVITTPVGVFLEIIEEGQNGFLVQPGDKDAIAKRILELLGNKQLREMMGKNNIEKVSRKFDVNSIVGQLSRIYEGLLKES